MTTIKKVLRRIRGKRTPVLKPPERIDVRIETAAGSMRLADMRDEQTDFLRERAFRKAQEARAEQLEAQEQEKERQAQIAENRLKNLAKARKVRAKNEQLRNATV